MNINGEKLGYVEIENNRFTSKTLSDQVFHKMNKSNRPVPMFSPGWTSIGVLKSLLADWLDKICNLLVESYQCSHNLSTTLEILKFLSMSSHFFDKIGSHPHRILFEQLFVVICTTIVTISVFGDTNKDFFEDAASIGVSKSLSSTKFLTLTATKWKLI